MSAYVLVQANVVDEDAFREYHARVPDTLVPYGGRYLVRGGRIELSVGSPLAYQRVVIIQFPSMDSALQWFRSPEYAAARVVKGDSMQGSLTILEGID